MRLDLKHMLLLLVLMAVWVSAAASDYEAGVAKVKITPPSPYWMSGFAARTTPSEGTRQELWAKALALRDARGQRVVIVSLDLLGLSDTVSGEIFRRATERCGLKRSELMLACSHTHSGPVTQDNLKLLYDFSAEDKTRVKEYSAGLVDRVVMIIDEALANLTPAELFIGHGSAGFAINRRSRAPGGPMDHDVPVLKVVDASSGALRAVFFGYACHNTTSGGTQGKEFFMFNGDYAGWAAETLEKQFPNTWAMFTMLCGADQNPAPRGSLELIRQHGQTLAGEVARVLGAPMRPVRGPIRAACETVELDLAAHTRQTFEAELKKNEGPKGEAVRVRRAKLMLEAYDRGRPIRRVAYPVQTIRFGEELTLLVLAGEVVVDYALRAKREYPGENLMVIGYANEVMGYIPSQRVLKEGGYEADTSQIYYGLPGPYADGVEERVFGGIHKALEAVGLKAAGPAGK